jgi:hypothetical protein
MLIVLSPAKTLDATPAIPKGVSLTEPGFLIQATILAEQLAKFSEKNICNLMDISPKLGALNLARYESFAPGTHPAAWMFRGDVYDGFDIDTLPPKALPDLQKRLRILSGLYGVLRPSDAMHPYRLEMGTALKTKTGKNLYAFWGDRISQALNEAARVADTNLLLNLASIEYAHAIDRDALTLRIIDIQFKEKKGGTLKTVALFSKRARGRMARWMIEQKAQRKDLPQFAEDGYRFDKKLSTTDTLVFVR